MLALFSQVGALHVAHSLQSTSCFNMLCLCYSSLADFKSFATAAALPPNVSGVRVRCVAPLSSSFHPTLVLISSPPPIHSSLVNVWATKRPFARPTTALLGTLYGEGCACLPPC